MSKGEKILWAIVEKKLRVLQGHKLKAIMSAPDYKPTFTVDELKNALAPNIFKGEN